MADYILAVRKIDQENDASLKSRVFNLVRNIACMRCAKGVPRGGKQIIFETGGSYFGLRYDM